MSVSYTNQHLPGHQVRQQPSQHHQYQQRQRSVQASQPGQPSQEFPYIGAVNLSGYSKFAPTHGVEHFIENNNARPVRSRASPLFVTKKKGAEQELKTMLATSNISRSKGLSWVAPCISSRIRMEAGGPVSTSAVLTSKSQLTHKCP